MYASPGSQVTEFVRLGEGEHIIKDYFAVFVKKFFTKLEGHIVVTNKRVMFYGKGASIGTNAFLLEEAHIENVVGTDVYASSVTNIGLLVGGIAMLVLGIMFLLFSFMAHGLFFLLFLFSLLFIAGGIVMMVYAFQKFFFAIIKIKNAPAIEIGGMKRGMTGKAGPDAFALVAELGAMIIDVQAKGNSVLARPPIPMQARAPYFGPPMGPSPMEMPVLPPPSSPPPPHGPARPAAPQGPPPVPPPF